mgnify:CR=1 FL=1
MALADLAACTRLVQAFNPISVAISADNLSSEIDVRGYYEALVILNIGALAATATLDVSILSSPTTAGTFDATVANFTQQTQAAVDASNSVVVGRILCNGTEPFWKVSNTVVAAAAVFSVSLLLIPYNTGDTDNTAMDFTV